MSKKLSFSDKAYEYIKEQILVQSLLPGSPINEAQIAAELGMSRTPIRDAISVR